MRYTVVAAALVAAAFGASAPALADEVFTCIGPAEGLPSVCGGAGTNGSGVGVAAFVATSDVQAGAVAIAGTDEGVPVATVFVCAIEPGSFPDECAAAVCLRDGAVTVNEPQQCFLPGP